MQKGEEKHFISGKVLLQTDQDFRKTTEPAWGSRPEGRNRGEGLRAAVQGHSLFHCATPTCWEHHAHYRWGSPTFFSECLPLYSLTSHCLFRSSLPDFCLPCVLPSSADALTLASSFHHPLAAFHTAHPLP